MNKTKYHYMPICDDCVKAKGNECHTPGCALWMHDVPSHPLNEYLALSQEAVGFCSVAEALVRAGIEARERELYEMRTEE